MQTNLSGLTLLGLNDNQISNLEGIPTLLGLKVLWHSENPLTEVAPLAGFSGLEHLYLNAAGVTDMGTLDHLVAEGQTIFDY